MGAPSGPLDVEPSQSKLLRVEVHAVADCHVARLFGEIDLSNAADLQSVLSGLVKQGPVVVDLSGLEFVDSTGLSALIVARRQAEASGNRVALAGARGPVRRVLAITELDRHLGSYDDVPAAVAGLKSSGDGQRSGG